LLTPLFCFAPLVWPIANYQLPFAVVQPGWEGCRLKQHEAVARALQKLLHKPFRISEAFGAVSRPFWTARKRSQALNALQKLLHKPFRISEAFGAVSRPFGLRVKRSQALNAEC
jgi:hypothetical protein